MQAATDRAVAWIVGAEVVVLGVLGRRWVRNDAPALEWNDSADYAEAAAGALWSLERFAGSRPVLLPLVLSAVGRDHQQLADVQALVAALAWGVLAFAVARTLAGTWRPVAAGTAVLLLSLTWPLSMWDQQVLTESLALSSLVLVTAAGIAFARRPAAPWPTAGLVAACWLFLLARDSHVVPVALLGLGLAVGAARVTDRRRLVLGLGAAYLLALCLLTAGSARHGERDRIPIEHVFAVRILPYPDRVAWMADHGMPDEELVLALPETTAADEHRPPVTFGTDAPELARWRAWLGEHGRTAVATYALSHPTYLFGEGLREPERVFNSGGGIDAYKPLAQRDLPLPDGLANPQTAAVLLVGIGALGLALHRHRLRHPLCLVGTVLAITAAPHGLVVWHADGMEAARHLLMASVQLRLGVVLLVLGATMGVLGDPATAAGAGTEDDPEPQVRSGRAVPSVATQR